MRIDLIFVGIALILLGIALLGLSAGQVHYGGVVIIGPFPIVFGSSPDMVILGIVLALILLTFMLILARW
ncbi:TIGR00304 family membrane protein [Archaeoglobus profundus]|uniref:DUF131 domain-containing protein n=1 Tax=Archaeoglobus profundus (strain DSM 5631 / JCM 9629 / NBRC 100127 / Av18) TaxID=572546 RepID=D2RHD6_ARCPA|nr:DUF131 domain-containing protein [Archaeoglobus profundus]ADB57711.1 Protein of unknown function DUF131 [Archaeoglobus profundus DSM 5631]